MMCYRCWGFGGALLSFAADQLHKWLMLNGLEIAARPPIELTSFFNLVMVWNRGVSFGLFSNHDGEGAVYLTLLALVLSLMLGVWLWRCQDRFVSIALGLVIGGALGNALDRVRFGAVADFFDFHVSGWHYPAFNIADSAIFIGVCLLLWDSFFRKGPSKEPSKR